MPWKAILQPFWLILDGISLEREVKVSVHSDSGLPGTSPRNFKTCASLFGLDQKGRTEICYTLIHECWHIDERLDMILHEMQQATPHPLYWQVQSQMNPLSDSESLENLFPLAFHFIDLETANSPILLWAIRVMLWSGLCNLYRLVDPNSPIPDPTVTFVLPPTPGLGESLPPLGHRGDYIVMVHHVCQSVEYILIQETLLSGPLSVTPALGIVLESLRGQPHFWKEVAWLRAAIDIVNSEGWVFSSMHDE